MSYRSLLLPVAALAFCVGCQSSFRATTWKGDSSGTLAESASLKAGQAAPLFKLETLDHKKQIDLAGFAGDRPVLLMFGSYT